MKILRYCAIIYIAVNLVVITFFTTKISIYKTQWQWFDDLLLLFLVHSFLLNPSFLFIWLYDYGHTFEATRKDSFVTNIKIFRIFWYVDNNLISNVRHFRNTVHQAFHILMRCVPFHWLESGGKLVWNFHTQFDPYICNIFRRFF